MSLLIIKVECQNLISNPGFENGPVVYDENQVSHATGWNVGCGLFYSSTAGPPLYGYPGTPDLFDVYATCPSQVNIPLTKWGTRSERTGHLRYVGFAGGSYMYKNGTIMNFANESIIGTLEQPLHAFCSYTVSFYAAAIQGYHINCPQSPFSPIYYPPDPNYNKVEVVLRKDGGCTDEYVVFVSSNVTNTTWNQYSGTFVCPIYIANWDPNKVEFRLSSFPIGYNSPYTSTHHVFLDDVNITRNNTPLISDFGLVGNLPAGSQTYIVTATVQTVPSGSSFWWEVSEIDRYTGQIVPNTTLTNPSSWWIQQLWYINTFPGYCCNPNISTGNGVFYYGHKYRITRGTWGPCSNWTSTTKTIYIGPLNEDEDKIAEGVNYIIETDSNYRLDENTMRLIMSENETIYQHSELQLTHDSTLTTQLSLYPNPCYSYLEIRLSPDQGLLKHIKIFNLDGQNLEVKKTKENSNTIILDVHNFLPGLYVLQLFDGENYFTKKFMKLNN